MARSIPAHPLHIIVAKNGDPIGPFDSNITAAAWARKTWPTEQQDEDHPGIHKPGEGWDVWMLREPW